MQLWYNSTEHSKCGTVMHLILIKNTSSLLIPMIPHDIWPKAPFGPHWLLRGYSWITQYALVLFGLLILFHIVYVMISFIFQHNKLKLSLEYFVMTFEKVTRRLYLPSLSHIYNPRYKSSKSWVQKWSGCNISSLICWLIIKMLFTLDTQFIIVLLLDFIT